MEDLLPLGSVQYIVVGTYEVTMVSEYQGALQLFRSRIVFRNKARAVRKIFVHQKQVAVREVKC
jgi:hypothetical protein